MPVISNDYISIEVATKGAELQSLYNRQHGLEYMWTGDPSVWGKHSPVLFPIIGELKEKKYYYNGQQYHLNRHGFARDMEFEVTAQDPNSITFSLRSGKETGEMYPFQFIFSVKYQLIKNVLQITFIVENTGPDKMLFSVGGHPAFKVPLVPGTTYEDYELVFSKRETAQRWPISADGLIGSSPVPFLQGHTTIPLKKELFSSDAIVFKNLKSESVSIVSSQTQHGLKVAFQHFPFLGIWAAKGGDFVCIEPWCGIADSVHASGKLEEKEGINALASSAKFEVSYSIEVF